MKGLILLAVLLACSCAVYGRAFDVQAGYMNGDYCFGLFYPKYLEVMVGDTITFHANDEDVHVAILTKKTVVPGATYPIVVPSGGNFYEGSWTAGSGNGTFNGTDDTGSPRISKTAVITTLQSWTVTITGGFGNYSVACPYHLPTMIGTVNILASTATSYNSILDVTNAATTQMAASDASITGLMSKYNVNGAVPRSQNADKTYTYTVYAGFADIPTGAMYNKFYPNSSISINKGDYIQFDFTKNAFNVHTVSFGNTGPFESLTSNNTVQIATSAVTSAGAFASSHVYTSGLANTGLIYPAPTVTNPPAITFGATGTYSYNCWIHEIFGMAGTVVVGNAATTPAPTSAAAAIAAPVYVLAAAVALFAFML